MVATAEQKNYTLPIVMMVILFAMIAFVTNLAAPMGIVLKNQFGASNFEGMLGNFANFAAYLFMGIPAGKLIQKIGYKKTALLGIVIGFIGVGIQVLSGSVGSFGVYVLGAFIAGFCMCILNTVVNPMLNTLGGGGNKGNQLIQLGGTLNSLCATIVPMLVGALVGDVTKANITNVYPVMYIAMAIFAVIFIVLYFVSIPEPYAYVGVEDGHFYSFYPTSSPGYFLNINNNSSGTASIRDRVILYPNAYNEDQVWKVTTSNNGNWYLRSSLNNTRSLSCRLPIRMCATRLWQKTFMSNP